MKLIIQSDDLGITEAVSCGIARAAREGAITCTGLFSNMPAAAFSVELMKSYPQICLGEDINLVAGRPCADPDKIPSLVQKDGSFLTSGMHRAIDQKDGNQDHVRLEDCLIETEAQILKFRELTGKLLEYLHGHSYSTPATWKAMEEMGKKYGISLVREMHDKYGIKRPSKTWYKKPFPLEDQMKADLTDCVTTDSGFLENQIGFLGTHCGYVDQELFPVTTYTMIRTMDLAAVTGERFKNWLKENNASSLDILLGGHDRVTVFDAYVDEKSLNDALDAFFQTVGEKDQVILLSDMYGGSVNSTMYTYLDRPNTTLVAGVNLALVIGLTILEGDIIRETLESVIEQSREAIRIVDLEKSGEEEEDELF